MADQVVGGASSSSAPAPWLGDSRGRRLESGAFTARLPSLRGHPTRLPAGGEDEPEDPHHRHRVAAEACFFQSDREKEQVHSARKAYPRRKKDLVADPFTGEIEEKTSRRVMGFGLGFEKIFATTSVKLPVSAYTIFVELQVARDKEVYKRCFNGLHTLFDLKKWVYEKMLVPMNAYDLSYAEPGKAALTDQLRLLTTNDSMDSRTLAATRSVQQMACKGIPGVHSVGDIGVTRLYMRLKCRTCGDMLTSLQNCRKMKTFGEIAPPPEAKFNSLVKDDGKASMKDSMALAKSDAHGLNTGFKERCPGRDPNIEDIWHKPDPKKHCLFHGRGYELFEAARTHGGHSEVARIYISCGQEPSKMLKLTPEGLSTIKRTAKISY